jgi:hypothetical protein
VHLTADYGAAPRNKLGKLGANPGAAASPTAGQGVAAHSRTVFSPVIVIWG